ncbi:MAG: hypothetical protein H7839_03410 [Magnetococcus sp. YQC-5]
MKTKSCGAATLLASLSILVILTLMVTSSLNISTVNSRIVGNIQSVKAMESAAIQAMESVLSQSSNFISTAPATTFTYTTRAGTVDTGTVAAPVCVYSAPATGYSAAWGLAPRENTWDVTATITGGNTGAVSTVHQGVQILQLAGVCCPNC